MPPFALHPQRLADGHVLVCYLARGDVALSISLTAASTLLAVVLTPWLTWVYTEAWVRVWD